MSAQSSDRLSKHPARGNGVLGVATSLTAA